MFIYVTTLAFIFIIRLRFPSKVSIATIFKYLKVYSSLYTAKKSAIHVQKKKSNFSQKTRERSQPKLKDWLIPNPFYGLGNLQF